MVERLINENLEQFRSSISLDLDSRLNTDTVHHADSCTETEVSVLKDTTVAFHLLFMPIKPTIS